MSSSIPTTEPKIFTAGDTLSFRKILSDYRPADGWALSYVLVSASAQISVSGSDNGDGSHLISVDAATTGSWAAGDYRWQAYVTKGSDRHTVGRGSITVRANFSAETSGHDGRSEWQQILDSLESGYKDMAAGVVTVVRVGLNGRETQYRSLEELIAAINHAQQIVAQELAAERMNNGEDLGGRIHVRF